MPKTVVLKSYHGLIQERLNHEGDEVTCLGKNDPPLTKQIQDHIHKYGNYLTVRYWISDVEMSKEKLNEEFLNKLFGIGEAKYNLVYSEITGYLWTDEEIIVGGHDLFYEIWSSEGKWIYMEIEYSNDFVDERKKLSHLGFGLIKKLLGTAASKHFRLLAHEINQETGNNREIQP